VLHSRGHSVFPYTTLFRSESLAVQPLQDGRERDGAEVGVHHHGAGLALQVGGDAAKDSSAPYNRLLPQSAVRRQAAVVQQEVTGSEEHTSELQSRENLVCR